MKSLVTMTALLLVACAHSPPPPAADATPPSPAAGSAREVKPRNVPPAILDRIKISGALPHLPDAVKTAHPNRDLPFIFKICIDVDGSVSQVSVFEAADESATPAMMDELRTWRFRPQQIPLCSLIRIVYNGAPEPPPKR